MKRLVAIVMLLCMMICGAWAEGAVPSPSADFVPSPTADILFVTPTEGVKEYLAVVDRLYLALIRDEDDFFLDGVSYPFTVLLTEMPNEYWAAHYDEEALAYVMLRENIRHVMDIYVFCEHEWDEPHKCHCDLVEAMSYLYIMFNYDFTCLQDYLVPQEWQRNE